MFGIWGHEKAAEIAYYGLHAMQHRGQDSAGVVVSDGERMRLHKGQGLVNDVFKHMKFEKFVGHAAVGNVRNSSLDDGSPDNTQPLLFRSLKGATAIAHSGRIMNAYKIREKLEEKGSIFQTTSDTEILAHLIRRNGQANYEEAVVAGINQLVGAYSFIIMTEDKMYVAQDPHGIRPLSLGRLGDAYVVAAETSAFDIIGATFEREVKPGELIIISDEGLESKRFVLRQPRALCAMEYVYFSRPDSDLNEVNVHTSRKRMGFELAREFPVEDADVVTGVPDSSISAAIGYAEMMGVPYEMGILKNRYIGRTFIQPSQELREQGVKMKLTPVRGVVEGKKIVMIDDSIVRGTTSRRIVQLLKDAGAKEVHVRISSPKIQHACLYGVGILDEDELIASKNNTEEIRQLIEADSLEFLSVQGMERAVVQEKNLNQGICSACMSGHYPVIEDDHRKQFFRKY